MKVDEYLKSMVGKTFMHNTRLYKILSYELNGQLILVTDKKWFKIPNEEIKTTLKEFLPVDTAGDMTSLQVFPKQNELMDLKKIILENIEKVQKSPEYIRQANSIDKSVGTLINMAKLAIMYEKVKNK